MTHYLLPWSGRCACPGFSEGGFAKLGAAGGEATVMIEPVFAKTVNLAAEYHVYLTPVCSELIVMAVTGKGPDSFTVQGAPLDGKPSGCWLNRTAR